MSACSAPTSRIGPPRPDARVAGPPPKDPRLGCLSIRCVSRQSCGSEANRSVYHCKPAAASARVSRPRMAANGVLRRSIRRQANDGSGPNRVDPLVPHGVRGAYFAPLSSCCHRLGRKLAPLHQPWGKIAPMKPHLPQCSRPACSAARPWPTSRCRPNSPSPDHPMGAGHAGAPSWPQSHSHFSQISISGRVL